MYPLSTPHAMLVNQKHVNVIHGTVDYVAVFLTRTIEMISVDKKYNDSPRHNLYHLI